MRSLWPPCLQNGRYIRYILHLLFRLLHPYYWPVSFLRWCADAVGTVSAFVRATTRSIVGRATRPVRRAANAVLDPVVGVVVFVVDLPARARVEAQRVGGAVAHAVLHPVATVANWWRGEPAVAVATAQQ